MLQPVETSRRTFLTTSSPDGSHVLTAINIKITHLDGGKQQIYCQNLRVAQLKNIRTGFMLNSHGTKH
jgi:hypothetical protein